MSAYLVRIRARVFAALTFPADPARLNEVPRSLAFVQVTAAMAMNNGKFSLVSGGQGRLWLIKRDGTQIQLDPAIARTFVDSRPV